MKRTRCVMVAIVLIALVGSGCSGTTDDSGGGGSAGSSSAAESSTSQPTSEPVASTPASASSEESAAATPSMTVKSSAFPSGSASGTGSKAAIPLLDESAAQRISDDLAEALELMRYPPKGTKEFTFFHVATVLDQAGVTPPVAATDTEQMQKLLTRKGDLGYGSIADMRAHRDSPFNEADVVWELEIGGGLPDPTIVRLRDGVDFDAVIDFFVEHEFKRTDRPDGSVALELTEEPVGYFLYVVVYPERGLLVAGAPADFEFPTADASAAGSDVAELAARIDPGVLISVVAGADACTDPGFSQVGSVMEPSARASAIESIAEQAAENPLAQITGAAAVVRDDQVVVIARYPSAEVAAQDLDNRRVLLDTGSIAAGGGERQAYSDLATMVVEQEGDLLRYTLEPLGDHLRHLPSLVQHDPAAPWRICR